MFPFGINGLRQNRQAEERRGTGNLGRHAGVTRSETATNMVDQIEFGDHVVVVTGHRGFSVVRIENIKMIL
jgi:hypothetical protein